MNFSHWLQEQLERKNMTQLELANASGISQSTISRWIHGERDPDISKLKKIGSALGLTEKETLLTTGIIEQDIFEMEDNMATIPVLAAAIPCGTPADNLPNFVVGYEKLSHSFFNTCAKAIQSNNIRLFIIRAKGDSMTGKGIIEGNMVIFSPDLEVKNGDIAVIELPDHGMCIKEVLFQDHATILKSANPSYDPIIIINQSLRIVGKVLMHIGYL